MRIFAENRNIARRLFVAMSAYAFLVIVANAEVVDGFVTCINSPTEFSIGKLHVYMNASAKCYKGKFIFGANSIELPCSAANITVGTFVSVTGSAKNPEILFAESARESLPWTRKDSEMMGQEEWRQKQVFIGAALLEEVPRIYMIYLFS